MCNKKIETAWTTCVFQQFSCYFQHQDTPGSVTVSLAVNTSQIKKAGSSNLKLSVDKIHHFLFGSMYCALLWSATPPSPNTLALLYRFCAVLCVVGCVLWAYQQIPINCVVKRFTVNWNLMSLWANLKWNLNIIS